MTDSEGPWTSQPARGQARPPAGWYPDPVDRSCLRWWDGGRWGEQTRPLPRPAASQYPDGPHGEQRQPQTAQMQQARAAEDQRGRHAMPGLHEDQQRQRDADIDVSGGAQHHGSSYRRSLRRAAWLFGSGALALIGGIVLAQAPLVTFGSHGQFHMSYDSSYVACQELAEIAADTGVAPPPDCGRAGGNEVHIAWLLAVAGVALMIAGVGFAIAHYRKRRESEAPVQPAAAVTPKGPQNVSGGAPHYRPSYGQPVTHAPLPPPVLATAPQAGIAAAGAAVKRPSWIRRHRLLSAVIGAIALLVAVIMGAVVDNSVHSGNSSYAAAANGSAPSAAANGSAPSLPPVTASGTASGNYTYQEGQNAAMQVTYADLGGTGSTADANWCSSNDPSPGASEDGVTASGGFGSSKGTQWYEGCMALLHTDPPSPGPTATPTPTGTPMAEQSPAYQFGYQEGLQGASEVGTNGQFTTGKEWCEGDGTLSNTISDNNWSLTQVIAGCVAAMRAKGAPGS